MYKFFEVVKKFISCLLTVTVLGQSLIYANYTSAAGYETDPQAFADMFKAQVPSVTNEGDFAYIQKDADGNEEVGFTSRDSMWNHEEYPEDRGSIDDLMANSSNHSVLEQRGKQLKEDIKAGNTNSKLYEDVYGAAVTSSDRPKPDLSNTPYLQKARETLSDDSLIDFRDAFASCDVTTGWMSQEETIHEKDIKRCTEVKDDSGGCTIDHIIEATPLMRVADDSPSTYLEECGHGCMEIEVGKYGLTDDGRGCKNYSFKSNYIIHKPQAITKAVIDFVAIDDYVRVYANNEMVYRSHPRSQEQKALDGEIVPVTWQKPYEPGVCEMTVGGKSRDDRRSPMTNITSYLKKIPEGGRLDLDLSIATADQGEGVARIKIYYDPGKLISKHEWKEEECVEKAKSIDLAMKDNKATATVNCLSSWPLTSTAPGNGCARIDGVEICLLDLPPNERVAPLSTIPMGCRQAEIEGEWDFYQGQPDCYNALQPDGTTVYVCPDATQSIHEEGFENVLDCDDMVEQGCKYLSTECVEGSEGSVTGQCYMHVQNWDCGTDRTITQSSFEDHMICDGEVQCTGGTCIPELGEDGTADLAKTMALLNAVQFMGQDMECNTDGSQTGQRCKAFSGDKSRCTKPATGALSSFSCCEKDEGDMTYKDYLRGVMIHATYDAALMGLNILAPSAGSTWATFESNVTGELGAIVGEEVAYVAMEALKMYVSDLLYGAIMAAIGDTAAGAAVNTAAEAIGNSTMGAALQFMASAYAAYMIAMAVLNMIYQCKESDFETNSKRALKLCTYVGSYCSKKIGLLNICYQVTETYCCYNSILSRMIQEAARPQLGLGLGSAKNPNCDGIPLDRVDEIDWNAINWEEWIDILKAEGYLGRDDLNINLTGDDSLFDYDPNEVRGDIGERAQGQVDGLDVPVDEKRITEQKNYVLDY